MQSVLDQLARGILAIAIRISSRRTAAAAWPSAGRWYITRRSFCWMNPVELDAVGKSAGLLRELIVKLGLSALMVTHDQNEAMAISDRILLLNNGVIEQQGTPQEMYGSPRTLFAAEFMGSNNRLHGTVTDLG